MIQTKTLQPGLTLEGESVNFNFANENFYLQMTIFIFYFKMILGF